MIQDFRPPSGKIILFTHVSGVVSALVLVAGLQWMAGRANTESGSPSPIAVLPANAKPVEVQPDPNQAMAHQAWQYFAQNWQPSGFVNTATGETSSTLEDVATTLLALASARELDVITSNEFDQKLTTLLNTLEALSLNPGEQTQSAEAPPRLGRSLKLIALRYSQYTAQIDRIQQSWPNTSETNTNEPNTSDADLFAGLESGFPTLSTTAIDRLVAAEITQHQATAPLTANTNGLILSSLLYQKVQQPLLAWAGGKTP